MTPVDPDILHAMSTTLGPDFVEAVKRGDVEVIDITGLGLGGMDEARMERVERIRRGPLSMHLLGSILETLMRWMDEENRTPESLTHGEIEAQVTDMGFGLVSENGILDQLIEAWADMYPQWHDAQRAKAQTEHGDRKSHPTVTMEVTAHGDGWFKIEDIGPGVDEESTPGIGLGMGHQFTEGAHIAISPDEARTLATKLRGMADRLSSDEVSTSMEVYELWNSLDIEHKREVLANQLEGLQAYLPDLTLHEIAYNTLSDALAIQGDLR
jgi:hypothetical protein